MLAPWKKSYNKPRQHIKKQKHYFANKGPYSQNCGFSSSCVWMWELDHTEGWTPKNWCFRTVVLEKTLESPLDCKEIRPVNPKGNQSWIFIRRIDAEAEAPILWTPDAKSRLIRKPLMLGKVEDEEKGATEDEMVRWHHWLSGHEFEQAPGDNGVLGSLACCSPWGHEDSDMTEQLTQITCLSPSSQIFESHLSSPVQNLALLSHSNALSLGLPWWNQSKKSWHVWVFSHSSDHRKECKLFPWTSWMYCKQSHNGSLGTSLVVQWLGLYAPDAGGPGSIPGRGARSVMSQLRVYMLPKHPTCLNEDWVSHVPQLTPGSAR